MTVRILQGDCVELLRTLPSESVHCAVTSIPYWGLRDYRVPPSVWGGDPDCEHAWDGEIRIHRGGAGGTGALRKGGRSIVAEQDAVRDRTGGAFCARCGAWRGCLGLEPDYRLFVENVVTVFRQVWRVLRADGTVFLNIGDVFATGAGTSTAPGGGQRGEKWLGLAGRGHRGQHLPHQAGKQSKRVAAMGPVQQPNRMPQAGLKPKDLAGIPWRVVFALQDDGWWNRRDIIWSKPSPLPESILDRPSTSHEYVFLLTKSGTPLFWTHRDGKAGTRRKPSPEYRWLNTVTGEEAAIEPDGWRTLAQPDDAEKRLWRRVNLWTSWDYFYDGEAIREGAQLRSSGNLERVPRADRGGRADHPGGQAGNIPYESDGTRNARSVWTIPSAPFAEAHFAVFPPALAEKCVRAGSSEGGCCSACGAPFSRHVEIGGVDFSRQRAAGGDREGSYDGRSKDHRSAGVQDVRAVKARVLAGMRERRTAAWVPTCGCGAGAAPCVILDPFGGSGTTGMVADRLGRDAVLIELNPAYAEMARRRIHGDAPLFADVACIARDQKPPVYLSEAAD